MLVLKVTFRGSSLKEFAKHYLTDLGQSGMFVRTQSPLPVGTKIRFEFRLENDIPLLFGQGIVFWVAEENRELNIPCGMELRFDSLSPESENHFQWLQLEKRGVTVGTEVPLYIATSTISDPSNSSGKDLESGTVGRSSPRGEATGTLQGIKAPNGKPTDDPARKAPERAPTGPVQALRPERAPTGPMQAVHLQRAPTGPVQAVHLQRAPTGPLQALQALRLERAPTGPVQALQALRPERAPTGPVQTLQALRPERAPTGPVQTVHTERAPTGPRRALAQTPASGTIRPSIEVAPDGRATMPYLRAGLEGAPTAPGSRLPALVRTPRADEGMTGYRPSERLAPGDSDPAKMFSHVSPRAASLSARRLDGRAGRDTLLTVHELAGRRLRLGGFIFVAAALIALAAWWLTRSPAQSTAGPGSSAALARLVRVTSDPTSAEVLIGNKLAGLTPLELRIVDEPMLQLRHTGYLPEVVTVSHLDPRWRTEAGKQVLEVKVTLARAAAEPASPDAGPRRKLSAAADAAPERRRRRRPRSEERTPKRSPAPDEPRLAPEPEAKKPEPEAKKPEPEAKKPEPEAKKPEPEAKKPAVKTPDWAGKPEGPPDSKKKVKAPNWAD